MSDRPRIYIDFSNGNCRLTRADTVEAALVEAVEASNATMTQCNVLDEKYQRIAEVRYDHTSKKFTVRPITKGPSA